MKTKRTIKKMVSQVGVCLCLAFITSTYAQSNLEVEDGKLIVNRIGATSEIEVTSSGAQDAQLQFGDNGSAIDATIGWDNSTDELRMTPGSTLGTGGVNIIGTGVGSRIGLGTAPDASAKVFIDHNSLTNSPQLFLRENNSGDAARLYFGQFSVSDLWQLSGFAGVDPFFKFTWMIMVRRMTF
ncbi:MAG: hypothetical protein IPL46_07325 [Saprospiraceae bacterium]|nr:hypothetical protein [Saprospiraceae bacterium]